MRARSKVLAGLAALWFSTGAASAAGDAVRAPQRFLTPARADGINDAAVFGPDACEVFVYDLAGRLFYRAARQGGAPLSWNGRDQTGRLAASGVYVARIKACSGGEAYQSFALAK